MYKNFTQRAPTIVWNLLSVGNNANDDTKVIESPKIYFINLIYLIQSLDLKQIRIIIIVNKMMT